MDAVEFIKTVNRLCGNQGCCKEGPVAKEGRCLIGFDNESVKSVEETVSKVEQWAKDNPVKTRQSEFLKQFPNADLTRLLPCIIEKDKRPTRCIKYIDEVGHALCDECRNDYWNEEVTDND